MKILFVKRAFTPTPKVLVRGFTIIEVLIAIFILEIGILGVASFFTTGFKITKTAREETIASNLAAGLLDEEVVNSFDNIPVAIGSREKYSIDASSPFYNYEKKIDISYIDANLADSVAATEMKKIVVTIYWINSGNEKSFQTATVKARH